MAVRDCGKNGEILFDPVSVFARDHWQGISVGENIAVVGFPYSAAHAGSCCTLPDGCHALAGVAAIAADAWFLDENSTTDAAEVALMEEATGCAQDFVAVIQKEAELI